MSRFARTCRSFIASVSLVGLALILSAASPAGREPITFLSGGGSITAVWANDGADKVTQDELRTKGSSRPIINSVWNGSQVQLFGARNEVVAANVVLEAATVSATNISVEFEKLLGPDGFPISSLPVINKHGLFAWVHRDIELFLVRYLEIKGLSLLAYDTHDERHVPDRMRLPREADGVYHGTWSDRPDHDKFYPDIAVPLELNPTFSIKGGHNQSIWIDVYIPKSAPAGLYFGEILVKEGDAIRYSVPVQLTVRNFTLPDVPTSKTMIATSYEQVALRYTGVEHPRPGSRQDQLVRLVVNRQFLVAHRHKLSLIDANAGADPWPQERPRPEWVPRLSGELFTRTYGYQGPGVGIGNNVYSIGTYGAWQGWWGEPSRNTIWTYADKWEDWFQTNFPGTERFLYLIDESKNSRQTEQWAGWMKTNPGIGRQLPSLATLDLLEATKHVPSLSIVASAIAAADTVPWQAAVDTILADPQKRFFIYNGMRPASGSFVIEDDGVALRELPWGQHKLGVQRWFYWESTYYNDFQSGRGPMNVFSTAQTFGRVERADKILGITGWNAMNGDGVLFYPGTDAIFPNESYKLEGPISSLRLKHWRRGVQDVDYLALAASIDPAAVAAIVERMVPKVLWESGVGDRRNPPSGGSAISWSANPDNWEAARADLADIIEQQQAH